MVIPLKAISLLTGWICDRIFGDPISLPHLVVGMGKVISFMERKFNQGNHKTAKGAFSALFLILLTFGLVSYLLYLLDDYPWVKYIVESIIVFFCLAGKTLIHEVRMVFEAADRSLDEGRRQVGRIVGRDTASLTDREVRTAALETLAENLSDGVIAPVFWFVILGAPGMLAYKMINTLDSMVGYKTERYKRFGLWAAKIDDIANYLPARITAALMVIVSGNLRLFAFVKRYGREHASPNSGYPEAALAGILDCRFGGPHDYFGETVYKPFIGSNPRPFDSNDMVKAIEINRKTEILALAIALIFCLL